MSMSILFSKITSAVFARKKAPAVFPVLSLGFLGLRGFVRP